MIKDLFDMRMNDGSRHFVDMPEVVFFDEFADHVEELEGAEITEFITDGVVEMWLNFEYRGHKFSVNNQLGDYWFFVEDADCPEEILLEVIDHFRQLLKKMKRIAFYGGSFDPLHVGHLEIARALSEQFNLDEFVFIPAFHAPHKKDRKPTSAFHRFAMIALATNSEAHIKVSKMEVELPEKPYSVETLARLKNELPNTEIFFVMGADSWQDITTWREWETVLMMVNIIVVTRPDYEISFAHVTDEIRARIVDLRGNFNAKTQRRKDAKDLGIYVTDEVFVDVSATEIRQKIKENSDDWCVSVPDAVAKYIEKYELYK